MEERAGLVETDFGGWEGLTFAEARERDPELHAAWLGDEHAAPPGGESFATVGVRVAAERASIVAEYPGQTVVVVSHVTPIKLLLRQALAGGPEILYRLHLDLASLSVADFYRTAARRCGCSTTRPTSRAPDGPASPSTPGRTPISLSHSPCDRRTCCARCDGSACCAPTRLPRVRPLRNGPGRRPPAPRGRRRPR